VDCTLDEVVGVALALNRPIAIPEDLFEGTVVRILISTSMHDSVEYLSLRGACVFNQPKWPCGG
jgi:hypothetical protein